MPPTTEPSFQHDDTIYLLEPWRISPTSTAIMFNFRSNIKTETDGIKCITRRFGYETVASARQLSKAELKEKQWMVIEVCFQTAKARRYALVFGVKYQRITYFPLTTCGQVPNFTAIVVHGMPMQTKNEAVDYVKTCVIQRILRTNTEMRPKTTTVLHVWPHESGDSGIYNGDATVVLKGYHSQMGYIDNLSLPFKDATEYPPIIVSAYKCYMYCQHCRSVNRHSSVDCLYNKAEDDEQSHSDEELDVIVLSD